MLDGLSDNVRPEGDELDARATVPVKLLRELIVTVEVPLEPAVIDNEAGLAEMA